MNEEKNEPPQDENQIIAERRAKLARLREQGPAFPNDFRRKDLAADLHRFHGGKTKGQLEAEKPAASIAGRMLLKRVMGKASFATLQDMSGQIQVYANNDVTGRKRTRRSSAGTWATSSASKAASSRPTRASSRSTRRRCGCFRSRCARCRKNSTASPTPSSATASATSTSS